MSLRMAEILFFSTAVCCLGVNDLFLGVKKPPSNSMTQSDADEQYLRAPDSDDEYDDEHVPGSPMKRVRSEVSLGLAPSKSMQDLTIDYHRLCEPGKTFFSTFYSACLTVAVVGTVVGSAVNNSSKK